MFFLSTLISCVVNRVTVATLISKYKGSFALKIRQLSAVYFVIVDLRAWFWKRVRFVMSFCISMWGEKVSHWNPRSACSSQQLLSKLRKLFQSWFSAKIQILSYFIMRKLSQFLNEHLFELPDRCWLDLACRKTFFNISYACSIEFKSGGLAGQSICSN